jgi:hypothetical protein
MLTVSRGWLSLETLSALIGHEVDTWNRVTSYGEQRNCGQTNSVKQSNSFTPFNVVNKPRDRLYPDSALPVARAALHAVAHGCRQLGSDEQ